MPESAKSYAKLHISGDMCLKMRNFPYLRYSANTTKERL